MRRNWVVLAAVIGVAACARQPRQPVAAVVPETPSGPVQDRPLPAAPAPTAAAPVIPDSQRPVSPPLTPTAITQRPPHTQSADSAERDEEFLDSLKQAVPDTSRRAPAPTVQVPAEDVRREAVAMFGRPEGAAAAVTWDIDVASYSAHARVVYWMDFFSGRSRWHFERYIERSGRYDSMIRHRLRQAGLPQDLIYLAMIESGFAQNIRSRASAVGLWQFIAPTARRYGLTVDAWVDERRDPFLSTDAAIRFLTELNHRFGSWYLAAAAYNSGPGKIVRGLARGDYGSLTRNDAYFALAEGTFLRRETRDYVPKLIAAALLAKEPAKYGFIGLDLWEPLVYDSVLTPFAVGLDVVARVSGTTREIIEELNPRYFRGVTPPERRSWVKVPLGTADSVAARLAAIPPNQRVTFLTHIVERGETLSRIARRYGVTSSDIQSANRLRTSRIGRGQRLIIPTSLVSRGRTETPVRRRPSTTRPAGVIPAAPATAPTTRPSATRSTATRRHVVRAGESAWSISQQFGVSLEALLEENDLGRRTIIRPGQTLRIPNR